MTDRAEMSIPWPVRTAGVLAVSPLPADRLRLCEIPSLRNWRLHEASYCREALTLLHGQRIPVLLCERDHAHGNWVDLLKGAARLLAPPNLIVFSRLADESLWAEVLNRGGFDVLMTPFDPEEVLRVTFAASNRWECDFAAALRNDHTQPTAQLNRATDVVTSLVLAAGVSSVTGKRAIPSEGTTAAFGTIESQRLAPAAAGLGCDGEAWRLTILLADDEAAIRNLAGQVLRSYGYTVLEAADGLEALEVAERHPGPIHLLLTDWCMPRLDGGGLIRGLSNGRPETAILVMSGCMNGELPTKAAILPKPFNSQALVKSVRGALQGSDRHGKSSVTSVSP